MNEKFPISILQEINRVLVTIIHDQKPYKHEKYMEYKSSHGFLGPNHILSYNRFSCTQISLLKKLTSIGSESFFVCSIIEKKIYNTDEIHTIL